MKLSGNIVTCVCLNMSKFNGGQRLAKYRKQSQRFPDEIPGLSSFTRPFYQIKPVVISD
jgi:hypothetical protein